MSGDIVDIVLIGQLNARYAHALDGLVPEAARAWSETFTADGSIAVVTADGTVVVDARGRPAIETLWWSFKDIATTRHWFSNLAITAEGNEARMSVTVAAIAIASVPARVARTGLYADRLVRGEEGWLFASRVLTLDPASRV